MTRPSRPLLPVIVVVGVLLRIAPWWRANTLRGVQEYDDGVYYGAARYLVHGLVPYRDFVIVHPPGISLLLVPFALVGRVWGDDIGLMLARFAMIGVAVATMLLIHRLARRIPVEEPAALVAVAVYALIPNTVIAEHTVLLEPVLNLCCLAAVVVLTGSARPRPLAAGLLLALAVSVKLFALAYVAVVVIWLVLRRDRGSALRLIAGLLAGLVVLVGPFVALAPVAFWHDVVVTQVARPTDATARGATRLVDLAGLRPLPIAAGVVLAVLLVVGLLGRGVIGWLGWRSRPVSAWIGSPVALWVGILAVILVAFLAASTYFPHYGAFFAPPLALLVAAAVDGARVRVLLAGVFVVVLGAGSITRDAQTQAQSDLAALGARIPAHACVFAETASLAIAADRFTPADAACPAWVDGRGVVYVQNTAWPSGRPFYFDGFTEDARWQAALRTQLSHASYLLLSTSPADIHEWSPATRAFAATEFHPVVIAATAQLWERD